MSTAFAILATEAAETINPVVPDEIGELVWGAIAFFGLWIMMRYVCLPPLMAARERRAEQVRADREGAEAAVVDGERLRREHDEALAQARAEAGRIIDAARTEAETHRSQVLAQAEAGIAQRRQAAIAEVEAARQAAMADVAAAVADLATAAASRVVDKSLDAAAQRQVVESYLNRTVVR